MPFPRYSWLVPFQRSAWKSEPTEVRTILVCLYQSTRLDGLHLHESKDTAVQLTVVSSELLHRDESTRLDGLVLCESTDIAICKSEYLQVGHPSLSEYTYFLLVNLKLTALQDVVVEPTWICLHTPNRTQDQAS